MNKELQLGSGFICPFCGDRIVEFDEEPINYLIISEYLINKNKSAVHVHGTVEEKNNLIHLMEVVLKELNLDSVFVKNEGIVPDEDNG